MKEAMYAEPDAVAIAAPQIGESWQIFIVAGWVLHVIKSNKKELIKPKEDLRNLSYPDLVCINPKIVKLSKETSLMEEGCLSVRFIYGKVKRAKKAIIEAFDENGQKFRRGGSGVLAQIFQHEMDHLNGILFTDKAIDLETVPLSHIYGQKSDAINKDKNE
jgi:peptide deformylase